MCGTETTHGAMRCAVQSQRMSLCEVQHCGTAYGAMRSAACAVLAARLVPTCSTDTRESASARAARRLLTRLPVAAPAASLGPL
eukprot:2256304-Rhodomonas_salina.1